MVDLPRLPDELESNARLRVQIAAADVGTRRKLNFVSGATAVDDPINEKVDVTIASGTSTTKAAFAGNLSGIVFSGADWAVVNTLGPIFASEGDLLLVELDYVIMDAGSDQAAASFDFLVDGTSVSSDFGIAGGTPGFGIPPGVPAWFLPPTDNTTIGGAVIHLLIADYISMDGTVKIEYLTASSGADRTASVASGYIVNLGRWSDF